MSLIAYIEFKDFYITCERIFNPALNTKPVVLLANSDAYIIASSAEAKILNVDSVSYTQVKEKSKAHQIEVLSANYQLYNDISQRIISILYQFASKVEICSINNAFIIIDTEINKAEAYLKQIQEYIIKCTGITITIGASTSRSLAKIANKIASRNKNIHILVNQLERDQALKNTPIKDMDMNQSVVTILEEHRLNNALGIKNIKKESLKNFPDIIKLQMELNGISQFNFEEIISQSYISFSSSVNSSYTQEQVSEMLAGALYDQTIILRKKKKLARSIYLYILSSNLEQGTQYLCFTNSLKRASSNHSELIKEVRLMTKEIYQKSIKIIEVGTALMDLTSYEETTEESTEYLEDPKSKLLCNIINKINQQGDKTNLFYLAQGMNRNWLVTPSNSSPQYTRSWKDLLKVS